MRDLPDGLILTSLPRKISFPKLIFQPIMNPHYSHTLQAHCRVCPSRKLCVSVQNNLASASLASIHTLVTAASGQDINHSSVTSYTVPPVFACPFKAMNLSLTQSLGSRGVTSILATYPKETNTPTWVILGPSLPSTCLSVHLCWSLTDTSLPELRRELIGNCTQIEAKNKD